MVPHLAVPSSFPMGGNPPCQDWMGYPPSGDRAAQRALAMQRAVCLLHLRRTFLFYLCDHEVTTMWNHPVCTHWRIWGRGRQVHPPVQILSFSCSFWEIFRPIIGWGSHLGGCPPLPRLGNPKSATGTHMCTLNTVQPGLKRKRM